MKIDLNLSCTWHQVRLSVFKCISTPKEVEGSTALYPSYQSDLRWDWCYSHNKCENICMGLPEQPTDPSSVNTGNEDRIQQFFSWRKVSVLSLLLKLSHWNGLTWSFPWYCFRIILFEVSAETVPLPREIEERHLFVQVKKRNKQQFHWKTAMPLLRIGMQNLTEGLLWSHRWHLNHQCENQKYI